MASQRMCAFNSPVDVIRYMIEELFALSTLKFGEERPDFAFRDSHQVLLSAGDYSGSFERNPPRWAKSAPRPSGTRLTSPTEGCAAIESSSCPSIILV